MKNFRQSNPRRTNIRGFSHNLLTLPFIVLILGVLACIIIPAILKYVHKPKTSEVGVTLRKIYDAEVTYYEELSRKNLTPQFLSAPLMPLGAPTKDKRLSSWNDPSWQALWKGIKLAPPKHVRYIYRAEASGVGKNSSFTLYAYGDLDGDGITSLFMRINDIIGEFYEGPGIYAKDPLE